MNAWMLALPVMVLAAGCQRRERAVPAPPPPSGEVPARTTPPRGAPPEGELRRLVVELAATKACDLVRGTMTALHDPGRQADTGVLWVQGCEATGDGDQETFRIAGAGWIQIQATSLQGSAATPVRGTQRFELALELTGRLELGYDESTQTAAFHFVPQGTPRVRLTPAAGARAIAPLSEATLRDAVLGSLVSTLAAPGQSSGVLGPGSEALEQGVTATVALCLGAWFFQVGGQPAASTASGPRPVRLGPEALSISGPLVGDVVTIQLRPHRGLVRAELVCQADAERLARAYLAGKPAPRTSSLASATSLRPSQLRVDHPRCPVALVLRPARRTWTEPVEIAWFRPVAERPLLVQHAPLHCASTGHEATLRAAPRGTSRR